MVTLRWLYQNYDLRKGNVDTKQVKGVMQNENQVYWSSHVDQNPISAIVGKVYVHYIKSGRMTLRVKIVTFCTY